MDSSPEEAVTGSGPLRPSLRERRNLNLAGLDVGDEFHEDDPPRTLKGHESSLSDTEFKSQEDEVDMNPAKKNSFDEISEVLSANRGGKRKGPEIDSDADESERSKRSKVDKLPTETNESNDNISEVDKPDDNLSKKGKGKDNGDQEQKSDEPITQQPLLDKAISDVLNKRERWILLTNRPKKGQDIDAASPLENIMINRGIFTSLSMAKKEGKRLATEDLTWREVGQSKIIQHQDGADGKKLWVKIEPIAKHNDPEAGEATTEGEGGSEHKPFEVPDTQGGGNNDSAGEGPSKKAANPRKKRTTPAAAGPSKTRKMVATEAAGGEEKVTHSYGLRNRSARQDQDAGDGGEGKVEAKVEKGIKGAGQAELLSSTKAKGNSRKGGKGGKTG
ncbi:uncharacterized protein KY384_002962 [Bacidia gigantensis]|uniref:uncharacterized protein n=1 Tax=Bacidia gigantensis TaxID=2732470 RepID=UPI001D04C664|nr:uncharacterized protein KY384_002962 [Bacidia gigantensis]KAG8531333.1 hypothetical protein KY384_002962 [Bacidia gigantensis]